MQTIDSTLGKEFPQKAELELTRENHAAVIRELQHMQDDAEYVSERQPKTFAKPESSIAQKTPEAVQNHGHWQKMEFAKDGGNRILRKQSA